ncbi:MAG: nucleotidyltransferase domain-containing protein, partial [Peptococcaceae bacterium]|nr:nucleotidyltransferase domain-containing protein [Peptococcaceae bacterium]
MSREACAGRSRISHDVKKYAEAVTREFSPSSIMLFGSYANGNAHDESDIDVAVIFDGFTGNWLDVAA